ncbi:hypothetical protein B0T22DRAFT_528259 [Podospora appendiculata]|uniref:DUF8021 domain-containing protein n=1 Tax=Podospora appendiculata TaxID=314037 RepID=A0AAE0XAT4_9PEZI|nr:hypothetical protein B0T22DRAFT_528259 [Podospora appendiculata]
MHPPTLLTATALLASHDSAACTRSSLTDATAAYIAWQTSGGTLSSSSTLTLSANLTITENDVVLPVAKSTLAQPIAIDFSRSFYDPVSCASFTELVSTAKTHPYVIHTHLFFDPDSLKLASVDSVVTDDGDWVFDAAGYLKWTKQEKWDTIPEARRNTRAVIKAAGDAYLDQWGNTSVSVPFATPCARLEGGAYTGERSPTTNSCKMGAFPQPLKVANRRYVIDEEVGAVSIFNGFPWLEKSKPDGATPSSNQIRVEGGLIRYIHEITVCETKRCGR